MYLGLFYLIVSWIIISFYKNKILKESDEDSPLTPEEKKIVLIFSLLFPLISGTVLYYGWKDKLPTKAKQANKYAWIIGGILILLIILNL